MTARTPLGSRPLLWAAAFAWWTMIAVVSAINHRQWAADEGLAVGWGPVLWLAFVGSYLWVPMTVAVFWLARRFPLERGRWRRSLAMLTAGAAAVVGLRAALVISLNPWVGWYDEVPSVASVLITSVNNNLFIYWMMIGVAHALHYAERSREREIEASRLETQLARAHVAALQAQLQPHFLFNTLHSIAELVHSDPEGADRMIVQLSALLRRTLDAATAQLSALRDELGLLEPYLDIEQVRFGDRLTVTWEIAPEALDATVPQLILQPLVENALRHGLSPRAAPGRLVICAGVRGDRLELEVRDDGVGVREARPGVGLSNTRARLRQIYGDDHAFTLAAAPGGGTVARIEIPRVAA